MQKELVQQHYWDSSYRILNLPKIDLKNPIAKLILKYFKKDKKVVFEVGCFPGNFLSIFGYLGYKLCGIDKTPRVDIDFVNWLKQNGFETGEFFKENFLNFNNTNKYDVVCSFGFIEHFTNTEDIILLHEKLVKDNGYLLITTPNFSGILQNKLHKFFDHKNYIRHNIESMDPYMWKKILINKGYEIIFCDWFGGFDFWVDKEKRNFLKKILLFIILITVKIIKLIPWKNSKLYSPFCGIIAKKIS